MLHRSQVIAVVDRYAAALSAHDVPALLALFTPDAVHEEPAGSPPRVGRAQIEPFLREAAAADFRARVAGPVTVVGRRAAAVLEIALPTPDGELRFAAVDVLELDEAGLIARITVYPDLESGPCAPDLSAE